MKRILFFGALVAVAILPTACINNRTCGTSSHLQMTFTRDSVSTKTSAGSLSIAYDAASDHESQLSIAIDEFLSESLGGTYEGDITVCDSLVAFYQRQKSDSMTVFYNEYLADSGIDAESRCFDEVSYDKIAEGERYVTFLYTETSYMGGAHGSTIYKGATFRKSDGRRIGWDVVAPDQYSENIQKVIDSGLREYWGLTPSDNLREYLFDDSKYTVKLPACAPLFGPEGITFIYNEYEIAAYACGRPSFTVPYSALEPEMMVTARRLME